jgi:uncharacterized RDD family membrane protein YckC
VQLDIAVLTPEKTVVTYRLAGVGTRLMAAIIDLFAIVAGCLAVIYLVVNLSPMVGFIASFLASAGWSAAIVFITFFPFVYLILCEAYFNGQTLGKRAFGIRVRMADGTPITPIAAVTRNLLIIADMIPPPALSAIICMFVNPKLQRIGDLVANTIVVNEKGSAPVGTVTPHSAGVHPLEPEIPDLRRLRPDQYYLLRRFCDRYYEVEESKRESLIEGVWMPLAEKLRVKMRPGIDPLLYAEATVMKFGRERGLI